MSHFLFEDEAEHVIVGTGAGGATAARVLSDAGRSLVLLEEGPNLRPDQRPTDLLTGMAQAVRDMGSQTTTGATPIPLLQGRLVGGSTAINSGIIWRLPEDVIDHWSREHGLGDLVERAALERIYEVIERELEVAETGEDVLGGNGHLMARACEKLGLPGKPITRNARRCQGRAHCLQGCPSEARQSMDVSYIPMAVARGARLHALSRVERVLLEGGRAVGVEGDVLDADTRRPRGRFRVRATRGVIVAGGAVHTPAVLLRSGLRGLVGHRFQAHPGAAVSARFPEPVGMGTGATQGYEVPMRTDGFKIESLSLPPEMLATRIPGAGKAWQERLSALDYYGQWAVQVRMKAHGRVTLGWGGGPIVRYEPLDDDVARAQKAIGIICRMMLAVGATEVHPGIGHVPETLRTIADVEAFERTRLRRSDIHFMASHLFGTACAGSDPTRSVVGPDLQHHQVRDLHVMDASVFPTNLGVNPQHSIMAVVYRAAERLAQAERRAA
ncbi:MAG: GMC family oxidoreductase [Polyangiaceae bacterium]|nr:GMC family oxidoreductase [Polyangiaceae bacterium]